MSWSARTFTEATSVSTTTASASTTTESAAPSSSSETLSTETLSVQSEPIDIHTHSNSDDLSDPASDSEGETKRGFRAWLRRKPKDHFATASKSASRLPSSSSSSSSSNASPVGLYPSGLTTEQKRSAPTTFGLLSSPTLKPPRSRAQPDESGFYFACNLSDLPIKKGAKIKLNKRSIAVFRLADGTIHAMENSCEHQGAALACGTLMDIEDVPHVKCPGHNVKFNLKTGCANRGKWRQKVYATLIKREELWIRV